MTDNPVILSFHESLIRRSDIEILEGPCWLNDTLISFYFEYLEHKRFCNQNKMLFVSPEVTQCIKISPENELDIFLKPLNAHNKDYIFFALNDNEQTEYSGGSHWSLLVFSYLDKQISHYDSSRGLNHKQAADLSGKIMKYFGLPQYDCFVEASCLQQQNGYDCGIHVLCNAEQIADYVSKFHKMYGCPVIDSRDVSMKRGFMLNLIRNFKNQ